MAERTVDVYVAALPPDQCEIAEALRGLVKAAVPNAKESIKWAQPVYGRTETTSTSGSGLA